MSTQPLIDDIKTLAADAEGFITRLEAVQDNAEGDVQQEIARARNQFQSGLDYLTATIGLLEPKAESKADTEGEDQPDA